jgi:hypothetical protein
MATDPRHTMSTAPQSSPPIKVIPPGDQEVRIYSHSTLFYWWPVWAVGFIMAFITLADGSMMIIVPKDAKSQTDREVQSSERTQLHLANSPKLGVIYATVLILIILITNVPLRGLWSVIIILGIVLFVLVFSLWGLWDDIVKVMRLLDIRINLGGYVFISLALFIIWAVTVFIFDHRTYVIVTSGQVRVCMAIGAGETLYDTTGMTFSKRQDDLFRHWIVGLGSGDLIIHRSNTTQEIDMPNVLFVGSKIKEIERLIKERQVV